MYPAQRRHQGAGDKCLSNGRNLDLKSLETIFCPHPHPFQPLPLLSEDKGLECFFVELACRVGVGRKPREAGKPLPPPPQTEMTRYLGISGSMEVPFARWFSKH